MRRLIVTAFLGLVLAAPAFAGNAEDDLAAVRKAVASSSDDQERPPAEDPGQAAEAPSASRKAPGMVWFRVHVAEKGRDGARVSVKLPIGLARLAGDDWTISSRNRCSRRSGCRVTLGDLLRALDSGQTLVDIEDDDAVVRVWVE